MSEIKEYQLFIDGAWRKTASGNVSEVLSPSTGEVVATVQNGSEEDVEDALQAAEKAQKEWRKLPPRQRAELLYKLAEEIKNNSDYLAELLVKEQGKLLKVAKMEVAVTASFIEYACEGARRIEGILFLLTIQMSKFGYKKYHEVLSWQ